MEDWKIQSRNHFCSSCNNLFQDKDACFTVLSHLPGGFQRQDFCGSCWQSSGGTMIREKAGVISYWQGAYEPPPAAPVDPLPKEDAESLLRKLIERNDPGEKETIYILAVMLERKKLLRHRETQKTDHKILVYEHVSSGETFMVTDPQLKLDQLVDVQKRVSSMLKPQETPAPAPAAASS
jgi:hypothetical protein